MFSRILKSARNACTWLLLALALAFAFPAQAGKQLPLADDHVHDPANPGIKYLQEPREALSKFPVDAVGNRVNWVKALQGGDINPRTNILPDTQIRVLELDILLDRTGEMPMVLFPHKQHTEWLDCNNCHEAIFAYKKRGTVGLNMFGVLQGEFCGRCHGAVAFPLTECKRCHSVERK